jgi:hypothetical protein
MRCNGNVALLLLLVLKARRAAMVLCYVWAFVGRLDAKKCGFPFVLGHVTPDSRLPRPHVFAMCAREKGTTRSIGASLES